LKVKIRFPDGKTFICNIDIDRVSSIEDIAEECATQLCESNPRIKNLDRCIEAHKRWLLPHIYSEVMESLWR